MIVWMCFPPLRTWWTPDSPGPPINMVSTGEARNCVKLDTWIGYYCSAISRVCYWDFGWQFDDRDCGTGSSVSIAGIPI